MRLIIKGADCSAIKKEIIEDSLSEKLPTWGVVYNAQGEQLLTHTPPQWNERVLLVLTIENNNELVVTASYWKNHDIPSFDDISYYFGRFVEALLSHYRNQIDTIIIEP